MKIIWIIDHYSSEPRYGGISRQYDFAMRFSRLGYKVVIFASGFSHYTHSFIGQTEKKPYIISKIADNAYYVYLHTSRYTSNNGLGRAQNMFSFLFAVERNYKKISRKLGKPDVIEGASVHPLAWIAAYHIAKKYKVRFVAEVRDFWPEMWLLSKEKKRYDPMVIFFGAIERWAYKKADKIIYSMLYGDRYICDKLGVPRNKVCLIGQPLDCERYDEYAKTKYNLLPQEDRDFIDGTFLCVYTGYYMEYEGVYVMLEAAKILRDKGLNIKMIFLGSGQEEEGMENYVKENHLDNVLIGGRVSKEPIPALLRRADICMAHCATKDSDDTFKYGLSKNKINEYLYSGACIIYGRSDTNDPVASCGAGYVVKPFSAKQFADRIEYVYKMSKEDRKKFGENGKRYIKANNDINILTNKLLSVLFD